MTQVQARGTMWPYAPDSVALDEVRARYGVKELQDGTVRRIASWFQSPGAVGSVLASLASGMPVELSALLDDIAATRRELSASGHLSGDDRMSLDMLATWAIRQGNDSDA